MSITAQKSGNRTVHLRDRADKSLAGWVEGYGPATVFLPIVGSPADSLEQMQSCLGEIKLLGYDFLDGGLLVTFRCKRDADAFRRSLAV